MRPGASGEKSLSKSALKNQKKREAKKAARQVSCGRPIGRLGCQSEQELMGSCVIVQEARPEAPSDPAPVSSSQSDPSSGDPETDKKIKNIKKVKHLWRTPQVCSVL